MLLLTGNLIIAFVFLIAGTLIWIFVKPKPTAKSQDDIELKIDMLRDEIHKIAASVEKLQEAHKSKHDSGTSQT